MENDEISKAGKNDPLTYQERLWR